MHPQMQQPTVERLKEMLADQLLTIDQQARYIQELIAWGTALEEKQVKVEKNGAKVTA